MADDSTAIEPEMNAIANLRLALGRRYELFTQRRRASLEPKEQVTNPREEYSKATTDY